MLPNLPDEVFEMFIIPQSESPLNIFDSKPGGRWFCHFGGLSIDEFSNLRWRRSTLFFNKDIFHPHSCSDVDRLIEYCSLNSNSLRKALFQGYPTDSMERLAWHKEFIINTGRLCAPIVGIRTVDGLKVLDGTHRLSAAFSLEMHNSIPIDAWIGE